MRRIEAVGLLRQCEHREGSAQRGIVAQRGVTTDGAEACSRIGQSCRKADTGPAADAGQHCDILPAAGVTALTKQNLVSLQAP